MSQHNLPTRQFYKGETIFKQGGVADHMFIIKEGKVEITLSREDKTLHLSTLERNAFFGEMALISDSPRSATATAAEYTEVYLIDSKAIDAILEKANPILRHMLKTMVGLVKSQNSGVGRGGAETPRVLGYAHLIEVLAGGSSDAGAAGAGGGHSADPGAAGAAGGGDAGASTGAAGGQEVRLPEKKLADRAAVFFGDSRPAVQATLRFMDSLNLLRLEAGQVVTNAHTLVDRCARLPANVIRGADEQVRAEQELMELDEVEQVMRVDRAALFQGLGLLEEAGDLVAFRRAAVMRTMQEKGRAFFTAD